MLALIRVALKRPNTFTVAALRTPVDIFPSLNYY
jgi:hypothetical protein